MLPVLVSNIQYDAVMYEGTTAKKYIRFVKMTKVLSRRTYISNQAFILSLL